MASETFNLAILLTLKDAASGGLSRYGSTLQLVEKDSKKAFASLQKLQGQMNKGLALGGVGLGGLALIKKGVDAAGDYEAALLRMRQAYQENTKYSSYSAEQQEAQLKKLTALATEMGSALAGDTGTYANIFTAMNKAGIDAEVTLNGAGKAAAYLANVMGGISNGQAPQIAEDLGNFGKMFDLKGGDEYMKAVNMFAAINDRFNLSSGNLVEASKYFFSTAKGAMGLRGLDGAMETAKLLAFSKRYAGREGSEAGTSLDALLNHYNTHGDQRSALTKATGIKLDFFTDKGEFGGVENMFRQLEKLKALNPEERQYRMHKIFGEQGARVAQAMSEQGVEGWRKISQEMSKSIDVNTQINQLMDTYNAKVEALTGSWTNFKATAFTPLMQDAKTFLDYGSSIVNTFQKFSAENPGLTKTIGELALYGSTAMVIVGGFNAMTSAWKIWKTVSAFSRGGGLLSYLSEIKEEAGKTTSKIAGFARPIETAETKVGALSGKVSTFQKIASSPITMVLVTAAAEVAITTLLQHFDEIEERQAKVAEGAKTIEQTYDRLAGLRLLYNKPGDFNNKKGEDKKGEFDSVAKQFIDSIKEGRTLETSLHPERASYWEQYKNLTELPYGTYDKTGGQFNPRVAAQRWGNEGLTKGFQDPNVLSRVILQIEKGGVDEKGNPAFNFGDIKLLLQSLESVVGKSKFKAASEIAHSEKFGEKPQNFNQPKPFNQLFNPLNKPELYPQPKTLYQNPFATKPVIQPPLFPQPKSLFQNSLPPLNTFPASKLIDQKKGFQVGDLSKPIATVTSNLAGLSQPIVKTGESFSILQKAGGDWQSSILRLAEDTNTTSQDFVNFGTAINDSQKPLSGLLTSANSASIGLNSLGVKLANWTPPTPNIQTITIGVPQTQNGVTNTVGGYATGGVVERNGLAYLHSGNVIVPAGVKRVFGSSPSNAPNVFNKSVGEITPARVTKGLDVRNFFNSARNSTKNGQTSNTQNLLSLFNNSPDNLTNTNLSQAVNEARSSQTQNFQSSESKMFTLNYSPNLTVNDASPTAKQDFQAQLNEHSKHLERMMTRIMQNGRVRS